MKKFTINRQDWSGKEVTYKVYVNGDINLHDERFKVEKLVMTDPEFADMDLWVVKTPCGNRVCSVDKYRGRYQATSEGGYVTRDDDTLHGAIVQVLCNVL